MTTHKRRLSLSRKDNNRRSSFFKKTGKKIIMGMGILTVVTLLLLQACSKKDNVAPEVANNEKTTEFSTKMNQLWAEHMQWTYATVDAFFNNADQLNANLNRLLKNQKDIGEAFVPYFGQQSGDSLTKLLTTHITDAVPVLTAAKEANNAALEEALDEWYANAQEIGDFLASINSKYWGQPHLRDMWKTHITQTVTYSVDLLQADFDKAIADYQEAFEHMVTGMSDLISGGIIKKFPTKF